MGADGHLLTIPVDRVPAEYEYLDPQRIEWSQRKLHGLNVLYRYHDTDGRGEPWGLQFHEMPDHIACLREQIEARSQADWSPRTPSGFYIAGPTQLQRELDELLEKYTADDLALAERYAEFNGWLEANADDWTVWT